MEEEERQKEDDAERVRILKEQTDEQIKRDEEEGGAIRRNIKSNGRKV